jgi:hypothetical protein
MFIGKDYIDYLACGNCGVGSANTDSGFCDSKCEREFASRPEAAQVARLSKDLAAVRFDLPKATQAATA